MLGRVEGVVRSKNNETRRWRKTPVEPVSVRKRVGLKKGVEVARNDFLSVGGEAEMAVGILPDKKPRAWCSSKQTQEIALASLQG